MLTSVATWLLYTTSNSADLISFTFNVENPDGSSPNYRYTGGYVAGCLKLVNDETPSEMRCFEELAYLNYGNAKSAFLKKLEFCRFCDVLFGQQGYQIYFKIISIPKWFI